jgi:Carboxylesterase family
MKDPNVEKNLNPQLAPAPEREFATRWVCPNQHERIFVGVRQVFPVSIKVRRVLHRGAAATVPGEDCQHLNLWTPEVNASDKRSVMVYMHGGGRSPAEHPPLQNVIVIVRNLLPSVTY